MKAYHVYIMRTEAVSPTRRVQLHAGYGTLETDIDRRRFELLTHMYSCINHKTKNPDIPLVLITDEHTLKYYDDWQLTGLYDEVINDFHDDYPRDRIAEGFWASPKIWAMHKLHAPFVIFDADLVLHKPLSTYNDCDLLYLHREASTQYPNPYEIVGPPGFQWGDEMIRSFRGTLPMNCATIGIFNEDFKLDYVERYFDFVLDSPGTLMYATESPYNLPSLVAPQILVEQWLLAALAYKWKKFDNKPLRTRAVVKALWASDYFSPLDMDLDPWVIDGELDDNFYHLWGAKKIQNDPTSPLYDYVRNVLLEGRFIVEQSPQFPIVKDVYERIIAGLTDGR
ncbi:MAG: DUF6734 family protein [Mycobacteriaceae bacterium]